MSENKTILLFIVAFLIMSLVGFMTYVGLTKDLLPPEGYTLDPCQQIHGLKTIESRDYKPKHNRELRQVVSTCGEG